jgi:7-cyano-7-deazaguanine reductase
MESAEMSDTMVLGRPAEIPTNPDAAQLDRVPNQHADRDYVVRFAIPEFTALCPITGQPDFAHLIIDYVPDKWMIESKSLKLYMFSFRNHGSFHESTTVKIGKRLVEALEPRWLRIGGYWYPRGGMPIDVFWQTGEAPKGIWLPDTGVQPYRGRG